MSLQVKYLLQYGLASQRQVRPTQCISCYTISRPKNQLKSQRRQFFEKLFVMIAFDPAVHDSN